MNDKLTHLPIEPYRMRYTEFLSTWEREAFGQLFDVNTVTPTDTPSVVMDITRGSVLDSVARPTWAMQQTIALINQGGVPNLGKIYLSDFYHPGLDAIRYCNRGGKLFAFCWAQTFDCHDFTAKQFMNWMRSWEFMAMEIYEKIFVASSMLKELMVAVNPGVEHKVEVVGLPFNSKHVSEQWDKNKVPDQQVDVVYTSRWDTEKMPELFLGLVDKRPDLKFAVCTGWNDLRGTSTGAINWARKLIANGKLTLFAGLTKGEYYSILTRCRVQFNSALQDWVSYTLLEALTYGCLPLYPNHRSFPEALNHSDEFLYRPLDIDDANRKLNILLDLRKSGMDAHPYKDDILAFHDLALTKIASMIKSL
jgi:hypothetical protein